MNTARPLTMAGSYPPLSITTHRSSNPGVPDFSSFTGPMGGGRGAKSVQDSAIQRASSLQGGGKVQRYLGGFDVSVTSSATNCVPPERSDRMATVWNSSCCFIPSFVEEAPLPSTQTSRTMVEPST